MPPWRAESAPAPSGDPVTHHASGITALLGPTNTGKTHQAIERMLEHRTGMIGLPLRLLAREVYDRISARLGERAVALVTGEDKRVPPRPRYWVCTVESMPSDLDVDFVAIDEVQLAEHQQRGHTFTDRILRMRGRLETWLLGSDTMRPLVRELLPTAHIQQHARFSKLSYTGVHSLASLPPRTAVVAFSADDVYALAERLRQRHGGTAVVLGALSPRARNAQVALYQAGEVRHMVATDAIGMGLNMDVDRVVFASRHKFDGRQRRDLDVAEMAQIAGRAGRYTRDGGFGLLRPQQPLPPRIVSAIEGHHFAPVRTLVWRNSALDFASVDALVASLRKRPRHPALRIVERADDYDALMRLVRDPGVRRCAAHPDGVALLWDVCRIPDFRQLLLDSHVELLATVFEQLSAPAGRIDEDWMAKRIAPLSNPAGELQALMRQIAFIRTWTYICNHSAWVADPEHWQQRTRDIEDQCSDALHERLTARFVDGRSGESSSVPRGRVRAKPRAHHDVVPRVTGSPFAALAALEDVLPNAPGAAPSDDEQARVRWVQAVVDAPFDALVLGADGRISFGGAPLASLRRGSDLLHPRVALTVEGVGAGARSRLSRRAQAWVRDAVAELSAPLAEVPDDVQPAARGLIYQLTCGLGIVWVAHARPQLDRLTTPSRAALVRAGVVLGTQVVALRTTFDARRVRWRSALWLAFAGPRAEGAVPPSDALSVAPRAEVDPDYYLRIGYPVVGGRAVHVDALHDAASRLAALGRGPWPLPAGLQDCLGVDGEALDAIVFELGYRQGPQGWSVVPRRRRRGRGRGRTPAKDSGSSA